MNIASIQFPCFNPYMEPTIEIYVSGCNRKCKGCHNPELQNFNYGEPLDLEKLINYLKEREELFTSISITGGDLLEQNSNEAYIFITELRLNFPNKMLWLFTGAEKEEVLSYKLLINNFDFIKVGKYIVELEQEGFPTSVNQELLKKGKDY
jgi:anaerobic ribonucleoside-triphosphate reductase activating protein